MARYNGPRARVCRRLEYPVFESPKFSAMRKNYPLLGSMDQIKDVQNYQIMEFN